MNVQNFKLTCSALILGLMSLIVQAAPQAMLEKGQTYGLNNSVFGFSVPTVDGTGKIKYFDIVVDLAVGADGTISPTANVTSSPSLIIPTVSVALGRYQETGSPDVCTVKNLKLNSGRIESLFTCKDGTNIFTFSIVNGAINAGHPYQAQLLAQGVNLLPDVANMTWGILTSSSTGYLGDCQIYGVGNDVIGIKATGNQIIVSAYRGGSTSTKPTFDCSNALNKLP